MSIERRIGRLEKAAPRAVPGPEPLSDHELAEGLWAFVVENQNQDTSWGQAALAFREVLEEIERASGEHTEAR